MKTKTVAISLILTFTSYALFAKAPAEYVIPNNTSIMDTIPKDTIPKDTIPKDTIPKKDTTANLSSHVKVNSSLKSISKDNSGLANPMNRQNVYATLPVVKDYELTFSKK